MDNTKAMDKSLTSMINLLERRRNFFIEEKNKKAKFNNAQVRCPSCQKINFGMSRLCKFCGFKLTVGKNK